MEVIPTESPKTTYELWMESEGIPIVGGHGATDVRNLERRPWGRSGGLASFIDLIGMEGFTHMYVGEIPPGESLKPMKHLYEQVILIVEGRGSSEVWLDGDDDRKIRFEWAEGSLFGTPLNCWYRLHNGSNKRVVYLAVGNAPVFMDIAHNEEFIFNNPFRFTDRFKPDSDYYEREKRFERLGVMRWETNFIADVAAAKIDVFEKKGSGVKLTDFQLSSNSLMGHLSEWPVGRYHKAHHHGGGAILYIVRSVGYTLMWPLWAGTRPFASGNGDTVVKVDWQPGAVCSPPAKWFHQHFNTGPEPARQVAFRYGSTSMHLVGFATKSAIPYIRGTPAVYVSYRDGGNLITYEDEDPYFRELYEAECRKNGVEVTMPPVEYRRD